MLRRVALILLALALVAGGRLSVSAQAAPQPCAMEAGAGDGAMRATQPDKPTAPCENSTPACAKQGCFLPGVVLPAPVASVAPALFMLVRYPPAASRRGGRTVEPELFPPIPA